MVTKFTLLGGALCLDFVNTVGGHSAGNIVREKLRSVADLKRWAGAAGLRADRVSPSLLRRTIELREAMYRIFTSAIDRRVPQPRDLEVLNRELTAARAAERLQYRRGSFEIESGSGILPAVCRSAADVLTSHLDRVRRCGGEECGWLFLDTSRNRSRQWCDMRVCGNRAKAKKFRERRARSAKLAKT